jgi:hypothetical protein
VVTGGDEVKVIGVKAMNPGLFMVIYYIQVETHVSAKLS